MYVKIVKTPTYLIGEKLKFQDNSLSVERKSHKQKHLAGVKY